MAFFTPNAAEDGILETSALGSIIVFSKFEIVRSYHSHEGVLQSNLVESELFAALLMWMPTFKRWRFTLAMPQNYLACTLYQWMCVRWRRAGSYACSMYNVHFPHDFVPGARIQQRWWQNIYQVNPTLCCNSEIWIYSTILSYNQTDVRCVNSWEVARFSVFLCFFWIGRSTPPSHWERLRDFWSHMCARLYKTRYIDSFDKYFNSRVAKIIDH